MLVRDEMRRAAATERASRRRDGACVAPPRRSVRRAAATERAWRRRDGADVAACVVSPLVPWIHPRFHLRSPGGHRHILSVITIMLTRQKNT